MTNEQLVELLQMNIDVKKNMEALYTKNKGMITKICRKYAISEPLEDIMQTAFLSLYDIIQTYDGARGVKFLTYATPLIEQAIRRYLADGALVRIPQGESTRIFAYRRYLNEYEADHAGLLPTDSEICHHLHINRRQLDGLKKYSQYDRIGSLDSPTSEADGENTLLDYIEAPDNAETVIESLYMQELRADVQKVMKATLTEQEQDILTAYYWNHATYQSIADSLNISQERARQKVFAAQRKLQRGAAGRTLREYAKISCIRYYGGESFFRSHGSIVEFEVVRRSEAENRLEKYLEMKRQEIERYEKRITAI